MTVLICIDTSNAPEKYAVHVVKPRPTREGLTTINGGAKILASTVLTDWGEVITLVEKLKKTYNLTDKYVLRRNVKEMVGVENYGSQATTSGQVEAGQTGHDN